MLEAILNEVEFFLSSSDKQLSMRIRAHQYLLLLFFLSFSYSDVFSQYFTNQLQTNPSGADVLNENYEIIGKTPFDLATIKNRVTEIYITKEGYDTTSIFFPLNAPSYNFPYSAAYCDPCRVEMIKEKNSSNYNGAILQLKKKIRKEDNDTYYYCSIDTFQIDITDTTIVGTINGANKKSDDKKYKGLIGLEHQKESRTLYGFIDSYLRMFYSEKDKDTISLLKMKVSFSNLRFDLNSAGNDKYVGTNSLNSEWQLFNKFDTINPIAVFKINTALFRTHDNSMSVLSLLISDIEQQLLENDTLYDFIGSAEKKALELSKGKLIELKEPKHLTLTGLKEVNRYCAPNVVTVEGEDGFGSGFFISNDGYLVTNFHVIDGEKKIKIKMTKGAKLDAEVIKKNEYFDLALLKVKCDSLPPGLFFGNSEDAEVGEPVVAIGTPLDKMLSSTLTKGIISGMRTIGSLSFIQTDVSINFGNSGGPLINEKGEVIGMNTMKATRSGAEGIGFAIPSNQILKMLNISLK
jgi:serine protease Do